MDLTSITKYDIATINRILARYTNLNFRALNKNGWECFSNIWRNMYENELAILENLLANQSIFANNEFNQDLIKILLEENIEKLLLGGSKEVKDSISDFYNKKVLGAIFKVMPDGIDPFFSELKNKYPLLKTLYRFHYLQIIYKLNNKTLNHNDIIKHPIGYNELFVNIFDNVEYKYYDNNSLILLISCIWVNSETKKAGTKEEQAAQAKNYYFCNRTRLGIEENLYNLIYELKKYKSKDKDLSFDEEQFLLGQCLYYQVLSLSSSTYLIKHVKKSYNYILRLLSNYNERVNFNLLGNEDKFRLLSSIPVLLSSEFENILNKYIEPCHVEQKWWQLLLKFKPESTLLSQNIFEIYFPLAKVGINALKLKYNINENDYSFSIAQRENILFAEASLNNNIIHDLGNEIYRLINKSHREDIAKMQAKEKATLSIFKHEFEKLPSTNNQLKGGIISVPPQICLTLRHAKRLVLADYALYFEYDSINRELNCIDALRNEFILELTDKDPNVKLNWEEKTVKANLTKLKVYDNETKYKCCICIRDERIISRYERVNSAENQTLFANYINLKYDIGVKTEGLENEKDNILIPVIAHNRKLGVLYLSSSHEEHFKYFDRNRLVNFAQEIGVEIFEAKMLSTFQKINILLDDILDKSIDEEDFMDSIAMEVATLFGSEGVIILWKQSHDTSHYQVVGRAGSVKHYFGLKQFVPTSHSIWANTSSDYISSELNENSLLEKHISQMEYGSYINIPLQVKVQSFNGYITLFDVKKQSQVTPSLREELKLLSIQVEQIMLRFFANQEVMRGIQATIGHDISSILRSMNGVCNHLDKIRISNEIQHRNLQKQIGDIRGYMQYGKDLLDFFFERLYAKDTTETFDNYKNIPAFAEMLKKQIIEDDGFTIQRHKNDSSLNENDFYNIILSVIQSKNLFPKLYSFNNMAPLLDKNLKEIPALWINSQVIRLIVNNLLDNFDKYHIDGTKLKISCNKNVVGWEIYFENYGRPLSKEYAENPYELFGYGVRFLSKSKTDIFGQGLGLFTSRTLIVQFGGDLTLKYYKSDKENFGTFTFRLFLPTWLEKKTNSKKEDNIWIT